MQINWKVRIKNKVFWLTMIPAILLLVQQILAVFGVTINIDSIEGLLLAIVDTIFVILSAMGVVVDMTTYGISDSERAMGYEEPFKKAEKEENVSSDRAE